MTFPGYSSVELYDHMDEACPTLPIEYYRPDGCWKFIDKDFIFYI